MTTKHPAPRVLCASCGLVDALVNDDATGEPLCARCWLELEEAGR